MIAQPDIKHYTTDEYLEQEIESDIRNEYRDGEIIPMTGGTPDHNEISGNLYILLKSALRRQPYRIFHVDQRLWIPTANLYTYPDVMVVPKPLQLQSGRKDTVVNPCLIAEVLSTSTQNYDRGGNFVAYRTIPRLQDYLLIDQYRVHVEHYTKTADHQWLFTEYVDPALTLSLATIGVDFHIADFYENVDFSEG